MDLIKIEKWLKVGALILWIGLIITTGKYGVQNILEYIFYSAVGILILPATCLGIIFIKSIRNSIIQNYEKFQKYKEEEIKDLRKKQEKLRFIKDKIEIEEKILETMNQMELFQKSRLTKNILYSLLAIIFTIFLSLVDLTSIIGIPRWTLNATSLYIGIYFSVKSIIDVLLSFRTSN